MSTYTWLTADTDNESGSDGEAGGSTPGKPGPTRWLTADTPPSINHSPSALLVLEPPRRVLRPEGNRAPRSSLGASLNNIAASEEEVLSQLQGIMHADELQLQANDDTELVGVDDSGFEVEVDEEHTDDQGDEDDLDPLDGNGSELSPGQVAAASSSSTALVVANTPTKTPTKLAEQRSSHIADLQQTGLSGKACGCKLALAKGHRSCLDVFSKAQLSEFYCEGHGSLQSPRSKGQVLQELHKMIWALKVEVPDGRDATGRKYKVPAWTLRGQTVCQTSWMSAYNYTRNGVRAHLALVLQGVGPAAEDGRRLAAQAMVRMKRVSAGRKDWATQWWFVHLQLHDFLPNESVIQVRGAPWQLVYDKQFIPMATQVRMECCKTTWMKARPTALRLLAKKYYPDRPETALKLKRSANHSRFAECNTCSTLKKRCGTYSPNPKPPTLVLTRTTTCGRYLALATNPNADKMAVDRAYQEVLQHNIEWGDDRAIALKFKFASSTAQSTTLYEGDDKCGSHWQGLPVDPTGRESKQAAKAVFQFSIQANVVYGRNGLSRFAITPKAVTTGGNFGLTNFVMALHRAKELGRLQPHVTGLYRHTDGGSDNLALVTHLFHWLLVYIGVFQSIIWFRFEAGHSHTELADRLFSILKQIFTTDNSSRVEGVGDFVELWVKLQDALKSTAERNELSWNLGNWDFDTWFADMGIAGNFSRMSAVNVYKYEYDESLWKHGGVKVTFKERLSSKPPHGREAEWSPIVRVQRTEYGPNGEAMQVDANVTDPVGVMFIRRPPDLRKEPPRESLNEEKQDLNKLCSSILKVRSTDLSGDSKAFWEGLGKFFERASSAEQIPTLPHTFEVPREGAEPFRYTLNGTPRSLLPMLEGLVRFERPLITWDLFTEAPPQEFSDKQVAQPASAPDQAASAPSDARPLRDPREANVVVHDARPLAVANADIAAVDDERWAEDSPARLEEVDIRQDELYLCQIEADDFEHEFSLGLVLCQGNDPNDAGQKQVQWFARSSKSFAWPCNPKFKIAYPGSCPVESFLLHITDEMLTATGLSNKTKEPRFNAPFMKRLRLFCQAKGLTRTRGATAAAASDNEEDSDDEEAEDRSCDDEEAGTPHSSRRHVPHLPTRTHAHAHTHTHIAYAKLA